MIFNLSRERLAHAYILEGGTEYQRLETLDVLVKSMLCENPMADGSPCGCCSSCHRVTSRTHEDVVYMEQSGKLGYKVADANGFIERLAMSSYGERNIGVIPNADLLKEDVQNKLLKTLEEPFPGTVIILETPNRASFLDTVRSRCVLLKLDEIDEQEADESLAGIEIEGKLFFKFRRDIDKSIKSQEAALTYLEHIEQEAHDRMLNGDAGQVNTIRCIEGIRKDIIRGMDYKKGLKKLYLELNK